jgi:hypothetical protein
MATFKFDVQWTAEIQVEALDEDEAYEIIYGGVVLDAYGKGKGTLTVDLINDEDYGKPEWGLFDTDPEDEDITYLALHDEEYL